MNSATRISRPVCSFTTLVTLQLEESPRAPGSAYVTSNSTRWGHLQTDGIAVVLVELNHQAVDEELRGITDLIFVGGERFEGLLIGEVRTLAVALEIRRGAEYRRDGICRPQKLAPQPEPTEFRRRP